VNNVSETIREFFEEYERGICTNDHELLVARYAESFMFASPSGAMPINRADFLKILPRREAFFKTIGLRSSSIESIVETELDESYVMAKVHWRLQFERDGRELAVAETFATYILDRRSHVQIVFQLDHQDLTKRVEELGLLPAPG
jgi:hypothetical protein